MNIKQKFSVILIAALMQVACTNTSPVVNKRTLQLNEFQVEDVVSIDIKHVLDVDIWQRIRNGFAIPDIDTSIVTQQENMYLSNIGSMTKWINRSNKYIYYILEQIEKRNLPTELALLPFVESAFNPKAVSSARAAGMWQFMPATGKQYNLVQNSLRDERRDIVASTKAALDYLTYLYDMFGDWHLALASYNWGEGSVSRAIKKHNGLNPGYLDIKMPRETQQYVPRLQALKNFILNPQKYGIELPLIKDEAYFTKVKIKHDIDIDLALELAEISREEFKELNPAFNKPIIFAAGTPYILLPTDNISIFKRNLKTYLKEKKPLASWTLWSVPRDMTIAEIAKEVNMDINLLANVNAVKNNAKIRTNSVLLIKRVWDNFTNVDHELINSSSIIVQTLNTPAVKKYSTRKVVVRKGDTLNSIASKNKVKVTDLTRWNKINAKKPLKAGQVLVIHTSTTSYAQTSTSVNNRGKSNVKHMVITAKKGDTLSSIALANNVKVADLIKWNNLSSSTKLKRGQKIKLYSANPQISPKSSRTYVVKKGDTLSTIAKKNKVSLKKLMQINGIKNSTKVKVGQKIRLN